MTKDLTLMAESLRYRQNPEKSNQILLQTKTFSDLENVTQTQKKRIMSARPYQGI